MVPAARRALDEAEGHPRPGAYVDVGRTLPRRTGAAWQRQPRGRSAPGMPSNWRRRRAGRWCWYRPATRRVRHGRRGAGSPAWRWRAGLGQSSAADLPWRLGGLATAARAGRLWPTISACCRCPTTSSPGGDRAAPGPGRRRRPGDGFLQSDLAGAAWQLGRALEIVARIVRRRPWWCSVATSGGR